MAVCVVALVAENDSRPRHPGEAPAGSVVNIWNPLLYIRAVCRRPGLEQVAQEFAQPLATSPRVRHQKAVVRKFRDSSSGDVQAQQIVQNIANPDQ